MDCVKCSILILPDDVRRRLAEFYNWNWTFIPFLEMVRDGCHLEEHWRSGHDYSFYLNPLMHRLDWWIHLLKTDSTNWRLKKEGEKISYDIKQIDGLGGLSKAFDTVLDYNLNKFDVAPV